MPPDHDKPRARRNRKRPRRISALVSFLLPAVLTGAAVLAASAPASAGTATLAAQTSQADGSKGGPCSVPGIGDIGQLAGFCGAGSGFGAASVISSSCKTAPEPETPAESVAGWLETRPARPPAPATVFGPNPKSTEYDQYAYAGLSWSTYDQPCLIPNGGAVTETLIGNWMLSAAKTIVAVDNTLHGWAANPSWMTVVIPVVTGSASTLYRALFLVWAGIALLAVAISIGFKALRSDTSGAVTFTGWAVLVITMVTAAVVAPGWLGQQAQSLTGTTLSALDSGFNGPGSEASAAQAHDSLMISTILYPAWSRGEFGDPSSATAQKFGGPLLSAQALSWSQAAGNPHQVQAAAAADQKAFTSTAAQVQKQDPMAYQVLTGNTLNRIGTGVLAAVTAFIVCAFDILASLVVVTALLGILAGTVMLPAVGIAGMHHSLRHLVTGLGSKLLGMQLNGILWAAAAGIDQVATRTLLTQNVLPLPLTLLLLAVLPAALWLTIRRLRGRPAIPPAGKKAVMMVAGWKMLRKGARASAREAIGDAVDDGDLPAPAPMRLRADRIWTVNGWPGSWADRGALGPVPPRPLDPPSSGPGGNVPPPLPPSGGGSGPSAPPPSGPSGGAGPAPAGPPSGGGFPRPRPPRPPGPPAPSAPGPREYTGTDDDAIIPAAVYGPGQTPASNGLADDGLYTG